MRIEIAGKLRPFSHRPGTRCLIPFTTWEAQIFPAKIFFQNLAAPFSQETIDLPIQGPVRGFTVLLDLERGRIEVFGHAKEGYFRYFIHSQELTFIKKEPLSLPFLKEEKLVPSQTRFSFGVHKKQDWELITRRSEMTEIFPFWHRLSQLIPPLALPENMPGTGQLLKEGRLTDFFHAGFVGMLSPRINDQHFLGLVPELKNTEDLCPIGYLRVGALQIQALFFQENDEGIAFLPAAPKEFHAGRCTSLITSQGDRIDFEWSKKELKKVILTCSTTRQTSLNLSPRLKSYRLRKGRFDKGERKNSLDLLPLEKDTTLFLDRFMH